MNIFFLDKDPVKAAQAMCDKHIVKMVLETAQILCTVSWQYNIPAPYKVSHKNHPMTLWTGETLPNWEWVLQHGFALAKEYTCRYDKEHKSQAILEWCKSHGGRPQKGIFTVPPLCMPKEYKTNNYVESYRNYYIGDKIKFAKWKLGNVPLWFMVDFVIYA